MAEVPVTDESGEVIESPDLTAGYIEEEWQGDGSSAPMLVARVWHEYAPEQAEVQAAAQAAALRSSQLETAVALYVRAAALPRVQAASVCSLYDEWSGKGVRYTKGDWLRYGNYFVYVEQDHVSQEDWTPEAAPSLYTLFRLAPDGIRIWEQPTHAENAFDTGERCHYPDAGGQVYVSKIDGNTTVPGSDDRYWGIA